MPTDENLKSRGCAYASVCSLCCNAEKSSSQLFLDCAFAKRVWQWFRFQIICAIDLSSLHSIFSILHINWSLQVKDVILAGIIHVVWSIWFFRNKIRFEDKRIPVSSAISMISTSISLCGNLSKHHIRALLLRSSSFLKPLQFLVILGEHLGLTRLTGFPHLVDG